MLNNKDILRAEMHMQDTTNECSIQLNLPFLGIVVGISYSRKHEDTHTRRSACAPPRKNDNLARGIYRTQNVKQQEKPHVSNHIQ